MFKHLERYPELKQFNLEARGSILDKARSRAFRKKGNNVKIVITVILIVLVGFAVKISLDLLLLQSIGQVLSGFVSCLVIFPIAYYFAGRAYASILRSEFPDLLNDSNSAEL